MNEIIEKGNVKVEDMIHEIRGTQVILDSDLAILYDVETKRINESVKRNLEKFPERFSWILDDNDENELWSQNATANISNMSRTKHRVFTEQGVAMLATILRSKTAILVSIRIMDTFVNMRKYISGDLYKNEKILINHENRILKLEESFDRLNEKQKSNTLFYEGQIYDAYSLLMEILGKAKKEIIIIDNYAGKELLDILKNIQVKIIIVSKNIDDTLKKKYELQYSNSKFINNNTIHDRFIIIDKKNLYTCGSSFKDLGKKCFYIGKIEEKEILERLITKIDIHNS